MAYGLCGTRSTTPQKCKVHMELLSGYRFTVDVAQLECKSIHVSS